MRNNRGQRTEPWGTPDSIVKYLKLGNTLWLITGVKIYFARSA